MQKLRKFSDAELEANISKFVEDTDHQFHPRHYKNDHVWKLRKIKFFKSLSAKNTFILAKILFSLKKHKIPYRFWKRFQYQLVQLPKQELLRDIKTSFEELEHLPQFWEKFRYLFTDD